MVDVGQGRLGILTISEHPGNTSVTWAPGTRCGELSQGPGAGSYRRRRCGILGPGILWDMGPRIPASRPALAGAGCGARGGWRRKDECPAYHGSSYRGPSRLARTLATTASRAESLNLPVRVSLHRTAARGRRGDHVRAESTTRCEARHGQERVKPRN